MFAKAKERQLMDINGNISKCIICILNDGSTANLDCAKSGSSVAVPKMGGYPSGQREQTVNLLRLRYVGSNPTPLTINRGLA